MKYLMDYKLYSHKIISLIMFFIFSILIDICIYLISGKPSFNYVHIIIIIFSAFYSSIYWIYQKYLIDNKYISLYIICSFFGLMDLIFYIIIEIIGIKFGNFLYFNNNQIIISYFSIKGKENIFAQLLKSSPFIVLNSFFILYIILINYIPIIYVILFYYLNNLYFFILIIVIVLFIFLLISIMIYLEIIELKFCGLNKNTRRNILKRENSHKIELERMMNGEEEDENNEDNLENNKIELSKGYLVDIKNFNNNRNEE